MVFDPTDTARLDSNVQGRTVIDHELDPLLLQVKVVLARMNVGEKRNKVLKRATEPVDGPCRDDVEVPTSSVSREAVELFGRLSAAFRTARMIEPLRQRAQVRLPPGAGPRQAAQTIRPTRRKYPSAGRTC